MVFQLFFQMAVITNNVYTVEMYVWLIKFPLNVIYHIYLFS